MKINFKRKDTFVAEQQESGNDVRWDGWKMIFFKAHRGGFYGNGVYRNGQYGFETVVEADKKGFWNIPPACVV